MATDIFVKLVDGSVHQFNDVIPKIDDFENAVNKVLEICKFVTMEFFFEDEFYQVVFRCDDVRMISAVHKYLEEDNGKQG